MSGDLATKEYFQPQKRQKLIDYSDINIEIPDGGLTLALTLLHYIAAYQT